MMRHARKIGSFFIVHAVLSSATATPVYLQPESRFPSGHHTRRLLENRTKKVQFQRWLRVETKDKAYGWLPEEYTLTALKLAAEAVLLEPTPTRSEMSMDALERESPRVLSKGTHVAILEVKGSWVRAVPLATGTSGVDKRERRETWLPTEALRAEIPSTPQYSAPSRKVFVPRKAPLYLMPATRSRISAHAPAGTFWNIVRQTGDFLEVRTFEGQGYLARTDVLTASDLGESGARPIFDLAPLRSAPLPYADLTRNLPHSSQLRVIGHQILRWGLARVPEIGEVWWPIAEDNEEEKEATVKEKISSEDLFRRKIFDMASSPAIPSLKFASAQGVFRTVDGNEWMRLPMFENKNYPIAIAGLGSVFVGPLVSDDQGETFQQWIRWDSLVATLRRISHFSPNRLQIQEIRPEDPAGRRVVLKLSIDDERLVKLVTDDQGLSWRTISR